MKDHIFDQLPVDLIAQLVEHCTGIAEVMDSNPVPGPSFSKRTVNSKTVCFCQKSSIKHHDCTLDDLFYNQVTELCGTMVNHVQTWFAENA